MRTTAFIAFWSEGRDSFKSDPPNADVSVLEGNTLRQVVVVLRDPVLEGDNLTYTVSVRQGEMPARRRHVGICRHYWHAPDTFSFAGARRRAWRRACWYR
jgi:hypothetical protein